MLIIDTDNFRLQMEPVAARREEPGGPYLEWIDIRIQLTVPGIQAEGQWSVMPDELRQFRQQIRSMQTQLQSGQRADLTSVEPGFELTLRMLDRGAIVGDWRFQPILPDGACVTGHCGLDQSILPELLQGIESLLSFSGTSHSP
ncbi:WapI family immunity protein [Burkholderia sola]